MPVDEVDKDCAEGKIHVQKLQRKLILTTGYICMFLLFVYFLFASVYGRLFTERSFSSVVDQLNQLSKDAEKASGS